MLKAIVLALLLFGHNVSTFARSPSPTQAEWVQALIAVHTSPSFRHLVVRVKTVPNGTLNGSPMAVVKADHKDENCAVLVEDMPQYYWDLLTVNAGQEDFRLAFMLAAAAHELGHCMDPGRDEKITYLNAMLSDEASDPATRAAAFLEISREEAKADAFGLAYLKVEQPQLFPTGLAAMRSLRVHPSISSEKYQVARLYQAIDASQASFGDVPTQVVFWLQQAGL